MNFDAEYYQYEISNTLEQIICLDKIYPVPPVSQEPSDFYMDDLIKRKSCVGNDNQWVHLLVYSYILESNLKSCACEIALHFCWCETLIQNSSDLSKACEFRSIEIDLRALKAVAQVYIDINWWETESLSLKVSKTHKETCDTWWRYFPMFLL